MHGHLNVKFLKGVAETTLEEYTNKITKVLTNLLLRCDFPKAYLAGIW